MFLGSVWIHYGIRNVWNGRGLEVRHPGKGGEWNERYGEQKILPRKKVLITGHTGFKGTWMCKTLIEFDANVFGWKPKWRIYEAYQNETE